MDQQDLFDPNPDIHGLFVNYDRLYFKNQLQLKGVSMVWSKRMTSCAGVCRYESRAGFCEIRLSQPLLQFRPRVNLVETLLHEMIHAYLFVTKNNRDRDGHGPEFHKHMDRINIAEGVNITVFHNFHDEVEFFQKHVWKCDGPCRNLPPFFGTCKRAMNRPPGKSDRWYTNHQTTCGGTWHKQAMEGVNKKDDENTPMKGKANDNTQDIRKFFPFLGVGHTLGGSPTGVGVNPQGGPLSRLLLQPTAQSVQGGDKAVLTNKDNHSMARSSGLDFPNSMNFNLDVPLPLKGDINWANLQSTSQSVPKCHYDGFEEIKHKPCIICRVDIPIAFIENHQQDCVNSLFDKSNDKYNAKGKVINEVPDTVTCPICSQYVLGSEINEHIDNCS